MVLSSQNGRAFQYLEHSVLVWQDHHWRECHFEVPNVLTRWFLGISSGLWFRVSCQLADRDFLDRRVGCVTMGFTRQALDYLSIFFGLFGPAINAFHLCQPVISIDACH
uniref:Uncharacterized protein n=1 Tax=Lactuca sativa TaxID=4236 RepID=A0A9R1WQL3_LACSA|nr:hypothetical protein LSAT_V11C100026900 [Lactuca sativa]